MVQFCNLKTNIIILKLPKLPNEHTPHTPYSVIISVLKRYSDIVKFISEIVNFYKYVMYVVQYQRVGKYCIAASHYSCERFLHQVDQCWKVSTYRLTDATIMSSKL